jgi:hypothetical protein
MLQNWKIVGKDEPERNHPRFAFMKGASSQHLVAAEESGSDHPWHVRQAPRKGVQGQRDLVWHVFAVVALASR